LRKLKRKKNLSTMKSNRIHSFSFLIAI
jgi:hypothetical protein